MAGKGIRPEDMEDGYEAGKRVGRAEAHQEMVALRAQLNHLRKAHEAMHEYLKETGNSVCEFCEACERVGQ